MSIRPNLNYPENMVWSLEPLQISSGRVTNGRILILKSSKAGGLNFGAGGPYSPVRIRDIREFRLYGRPLIYKQTLGDLTLRRKPGNSDAEHIHAYIWGSGLGLRKWFGSGTQKPKNSRK